MFRFSAVFVLMTLCYEAESKLTITVKPKEPISLIEPLEITCTFDPTAQSPGEVGYQPYNIQIYNDNKKLLGDITSQNPAEVKVEKEKLQAKGHLSSNLLQSSYLKLIWKQSRVELQGRYTCKAHARNKDNQETEFSAGATINVRKPSGEEASSVDRTNGENENHHGKRGKRSEDCDSFKTNVETRLSKMESKLNALTVSTTRHVETGEVGCGQYAGGFNLVDGNKKYEEARIVFQKPFTSPPIVVYSIRYADLNNQQNTRYSTYTKDITSQGFKLICGTWADSHVYLFTVVWHAFN